MRWMVMIALFALCVGCRGSEQSEQQPPSSEPQQQAEAFSLFGRPLYRATFSHEQRTRLEADLARAQADYQRDPNNADHIIWYGRRLAYLWRYREAVQVFSEGIEKFPDDARFYRHRGHRYITLRQFDRAIADLEKAAELIREQPDEIEPDGQPNAYNIPRSTLQSNIWYHLGLAYYLKGEFERALRAYRACLEVSKNDDMLCATSDWLYMTLRRLGREAEARQVLEGIRPEMEILENTAYHRRLLMYKGLLSPDSLLPENSTDPLDYATYGYGVGNWYWCEGQRERAVAIFRKVLEGEYWPAFGYIAAEADLHRLGLKP